MTTKTFHRTTKYKTTPCLEINRIPSIISGPLEWRNWGQMPTYCHWLLLPDNKVREYGDVVSATLIVIKNSSAHWKQSEGEKYSRQK
ncbi:hypothetical protein PoB_004357900 [Plakobranchus ocellatus]|uniref:Uncharacterized protein n=1 Tax=Plakobranchus ocellatus TaxID=259542 RepID=A0AAV4BAA9_9GAST|nr:hypothetical protein PoB_004357900 [Plakobranchus ocellatus]